MAVALQISYRGVDQSDALDALVADEALKLERYFGRILACRVLIEREHRRSAAPFFARLTLNLPGEDVFINHAGDVDDALAAFKDPVVAIRQAFKRARRQLQDRVRLRGEPQFRY